MSMRVLLRAYGQCGLDAKVCAMQMSGKNVIMTDALRQVNINCCVNAECIESLIALDFSDYVPTYKAFLMSAWERT